MTQAQRDRLREAEISNLKRRVNLAALIGRDVDLRKDGREWLGRCPFHADNSPSFRVYANNGERPHYHCFGCGANGDALDWLMERQGLTFPAAIERLRRETGSQPPNGEAVSDSLIRVSAVNARWARKIWRESLPPACTPVEFYWRWRGLQIDIPRTIRFHPRLRYPDTDKFYPAMVCGIAVWPSREIVSIHRTYLTSEGRKAEVARPKLTLGSWMGGAIRLAPPAECMAVGEGVETCASIMQRTGLATWCSISDTGMGSLVLPPLPLGEQVLIAADHDENGMGQLWAGKAAERWRGEGRVVRIAMPATPGEDFNDALRGRA